MRPADDVKNYDSGAAVKIVTAGESPKLTDPSELQLEDGSHREVSGRLPHDLPAGYHCLKSIRTGKTTYLLVTPGTCYLPQSTRTWGWAIQLYALRSKKSWGMGDLRDLKDFSRWAAKILKSDFVLINPVDAALPIPTQQASPYYPSSRRFLNPLYLRIEDVPSAALAKVDITKLALAGRALNENRLIDRAAVFRLKMSALEKIWQCDAISPAFETFCKEQGKALAEFATFCTLAEHFKCGWSGWPVQFHDVASSSVRRYAEQHVDRIRFHQWLQWLLHEQFRRAAAALPVIQDLPVGVDPGGADAWSWRHLLAPGMSIGAPPDAFSAEGQNWGMQPFIPQRLRASFYEPFRQTLQTMFRFGGGLRIDHVMGLFRLFWIPANLPASEGTYVRYPAKELLAVITIESQRARALVVGEDLGTVEEGVRATLRRQKILSYRLLWFESGSVKRFPKNALSAISTHDLFTLAGLWNGSDLARQKQLGLHPNEKGMQALLDKLRRRLRLPVDLQGIQKSRNNPMT